MLRGRGTQCADLGGLRSATLQVVATATVAACMQSRGLGGYLIGRIRASIPHPLWSAVR